MDLLLTARASWEQYQQAPQVLITVPFTYVFSDSDFTPNMKDASSLQYMHAGSSRGVAINSFNPAVKIRSADGPRILLPATPGLGIVGVNNLEY